MFYNGRERTPANVIRWRVSEDRLHHCGYSGLEESGKTPLYYPWERQLYDMFVAQTVHTGTFCLISGGKSRRFDPRH